MERDNQLIEGSCEKNYKLFLNKVEPIERILLSCDTIYQRI
jgi:hypothetical protein